MIKKSVLIFFLLAASVLFLPKTILAVANLVINPSSTRQNVGEVFPLEVRLETSDQVVGVDLDLSFDPKIIEIIKVTPGSFFANPQVLTNNINKDKGTIKFSVFSYPGRAGSDSLASLQVKILGSASGSTVIKIEDSSIVSGSTGKKIKTTLSASTISYSGSVVPIPSSPSSPSFAPPTPSPSVYFSPTPTVFTSEPTIFLLDQTTPGTAKESQSNFLGTAAILLIVVGSGALLLLIIFSKKTRQNNEKQP